MDQDYPSQGLLGAGTDSGHRWNLQMAAPRMEDYGPQASFLPRQPEYWEYTSLDTPDGFGASGQVAVGGNLMWPTQYAVDPSSQQQNAYPGRRLGSFLPPTGTGSEDPQTAFHPSQQNLPAFGSTQVRLESELERMNWQVYEEGRYPGSCRPKCRRTYVSSYHLTPGTTLSGVRFGAEHNGTLAEFFKKWEDGVPIGIQTTRSTCDFMMDGGIECGKVLYLAERVDRKGQRGRLDEIFSACPDGHHIGADGTRIMELTEEDDWTLNCDNHEQKAGELRRAVRVRRRPIEEIGSEDSDVIVAARCDDCHHAISEGAASQTEGTERNSAAWGSRHSIVRATTIGAQYLNPSTKLNNVVINNEEFYKDSTWVPATPKGDKRALRVEAAEQTCEETMADGSLCGKTLYLTETRKKVGKPPLPLLSLASECRSHKEPSSQWLLNCMHHSEGKRQYRATNIRRSRGFKGTPIGVDPNGKAKYVLSARCGPCAVAYSKGGVAADGTLYGRSKRIEGGDAPQSSRASLPDTVYKWVESYTGPPARHRS